MSKIISLVLASVLTIVAAGFWLKSSVSETAAGSPLAAAQGLSVDDIHRKANVESLSAQKVVDRSFVFIESE
jgi:hypothetical protein